MNETNAYQAGYAVGSVLGCFFALAIPAMTIWCTIMAFRKRTTGWVVGASVSGFFTLGLIVVAGAGAVQGFRKAAANSGNVNAIKLITAPMEEVKGIKADYSFELPMKERWVRSAKKIGDFDQVLSLSGLNMGVIYESLDVVDLSSVTALLRENIQASATKAEFTPTQYVKLRSHTWHTWDTNLVTNGMAISYRHFVFYDNGKLVQLVFWCPPKAFPEWNPVIDRIAQTMRPFGSVDPSSNQVTVRSEKIKLNFKRDEKSISGDGKRP